MRRSHHRAGGARLRHSRLPNPAPPHAHLHPAQRPATPAHALRHALHALLRPHHRALPSGAGVLCVGNGGQGHLPCSSRNERPDESLAHSLGSQLHEGDLAAGGGGAGSGEGGTSEQGGGRKGGSGGGASAHSNHRLPQRTRLRESPQNCHKQSFHLNLRRRRRRPHAPLAHQRSAAHPPPGRHQALEFDCEPAACPIAASPAQAGRRRLLLLCKPAMGRRRPSGGGWGEGAERARRVQNLRNHTNYPCPAQAAARSQGHRRD
mmetsp:Transcript_19495/g.37342  ORF Transcript_19495/g.37342 Transcript_19495/m.37342 type:complete len:263 (+) Transcript_19495:206-994(+)